MGAGRQRRSPPCSARHTRNAGCPPGDRTAIAARTAPRTSGASSTALARASVSPVRRAGSALPLVTNRSASAGPARNTHPASRSGLLRAASLSGDSPMQPRHVLPGQCDGLPRPDGGQNMRVEHHPVMLRGCGLPLRFNVSRQPLRRNLRNRDRGATSSVNGLYGGPNRSSGGMSSAGGRSAKWSYAFMPPPCAESALADQLA